MIAPRTTGFICRQSPSRLVTLMKSEPKKTRSTSGIEKSRAAKGERCPVSASGKSAVPSGITCRPGINFSVAGFGVVSVCMNMAQISRVQSLVTRESISRIPAANDLNGFSLPNRGGRAAVLARIDVEIDDADTAGFEHANTFGDRF